MERLCVCVWGGVKYLRKFEGVKNTGKGIHTFKNKKRANRLLLIANNNTTYFSRRCLLSSESTKISSSVEYSTL